MNLLYSKQLLAKREDKDAAGRIVTIINILKHTKL